LTLGGQSAAGEVIAVMMPIHALFGVAEAGITAAVVLLYSQVTAAETNLRAESAVSQRRLIAMGLIAASVVVLVLAPFASELPDGLEAVISQLSFSTDVEAAPLWSSPLADYALPGIDGAPATALVGLIGLAIVVALSEAMHRFRSAARA
jgi:hypothetical protein